MGCFRRFEEDLGAAKEDAKRCELLAHYALAIHASIGLQIGLVKGEIAAETTAGPASSGFAMDCSMVARTFIHISEINLIMHDRTPEIM